MPKAIPNSDAPVLSTQVLNRTLLTRQLLIERADRGVEDVLELLVGMQAQVPNNPYVAMWSRLQDFDPMALSSLIEQRKAVRIATLRATLHLMTARDAIYTRPLVNSVFERAFTTGSPFGRQLKGLDLDELVSFGRALMDKTPMTYAQLREELVKRWPDFDPAALTYGVHYGAGLVQIPPRGLWEKSGLPTTTTIEKWLGVPVAGDPTPDDAIARYLRAFGPASVQDAQSWSGLTGLRDAFERLRPQLRTFQDAKGRELFDVLDAPLIDADIEAPVRFLPEYDNVLLGHADRTRIVSEANRKRQSRLNGFSAAVLVDGFVAGLWRIEKKSKASALMQIELFDEVTASQRLEVEAEGSRLLEFMTPGVSERRIEVV